LLWISNQVISRYRKVKVDQTCSTSRKISIAVKTFATDHILNTVSVEAGILFSISDNPKPSDILSFSSTIVMAIQADVVYA